MCLEKKGNYKIKRKVGWKIFDRDLAGYLRGSVFTPGMIRPEGKWIDERDFRSPAEWSPLITSIDCDFEYDFGFHVCLTKPRSVFGGQVRKVKFRKVVAKGYQTFGKNLVRIVVAKEIFILPEGA